MWHNPSLAEYLHFLGQSAQQLGSPRNSRNVHRILYYIVPRKLIDSTYIPTFQGVSNIIYRLTFIFHTFLWTISTPSRISAVHWTLSWMTSCCSRCRLWCCCKCCCSGCRRCCSGENLNTCHGSWISYVSNSREIFLSRPAVVRGDVKCYLKRPKCPCIFFAVIMLWYDKKI